MVRPLAALALAMALVAGGARDVAAQTFDVTFHVVSGAGDDISDPPTDAVRNCIVSCARAHYVLRMVNCASALDDGTCQGPNALPVTGGVLVDTPPPSLPVDCAAGVTVTGSGSSDAPTCDALTNTVRVTGIAIPPGGDVVVSYWTDIECPQGTPWNHASFDYDQNPGPAPVLALDPLFFMREGLIFSVGTTAVAGPEKDAPGLPIQRESRIGDNGLVQGWVITIENPDCSPATFAGIWDAISPAGCMSVDCSTLRLWINDHPRPLPPGWRCPSGANEWAIGELTLEPHDRLRITFDARFASEETVTECCNQAWFQTSDGRLLSSVDPVLDRRTTPEPTCVSLAISAASRFDFIKIAEDAAGNEITTVTPGGEVYWRIQIVNSGNFPVTASLDDEFIPGAVLGAAAIVEPFASGTCTITAQHLACTGIAVAAFETVEMRVRTPIDCGIVQGGMQACNEATSDVAGFGTFPTHCPTCVKSRPANRTCVTMLAPNFEYAEKTVTDASGDGFVQPGETLTYRIEPLNTGSSDGTLIVVRDAAPAGTRIVGGSLTIDGMPMTDAADGDAGEIAGDAITARIDRVVPWAFGAGLVTFDVIAESPVPPQLCNAAATLQWAEAIPCSLPPHEIPEACLPVDAPVVPPALTISKSVRPAGAVSPGDALTYVLQACNAPAAGPASSVVVSDVVPSGTTFTPGTISLESASLTDAVDADAGELETAPAPAVVVRAGDLAPGECRTISFGVTVDASTTADIVNVAELTAAGVPATPSNAVTTPVAVIADPPQLTLSKTSTVVGGAPARVGGTIAYELMLCNDAGAGPADAVTISDAIPLDGATSCGGTYVAGSLRVDGASVTDAADGDSGELVALPLPGSIAVRLASLAPGGCVVVEFRVIVDAGCDDGETVSNKANASATDVASFGSGTTVDVVRVDVNPPEPALLRKEGFPLANRCPDFPILCGCAVGLRLDPVADDCATAGTCSQLSASAWLVPGELARSGPLVFYEITLAGCRAAGDPTRLAVRKIPPGDVEVSLVP